MTMRGPAHVGVIGGGTAGYFAALALRRWLPETRVTLVESSRIPIIGVGEATTPPLVAFLHNFLGIDVHELYRSIKPTWKLGIRFLWGRRGGFNYPFRPDRLTEASVYDGGIERASVGSLLMTSLLTPVARRGGLVASGLPELSLAYHLDNKPFVTFLAAQARRAGVEHRDVAIASAVLAPASGGGEPAISHLVTDDGSRLEFDFYVDCTGFRSVLMGGALGSPYLSYRDSLYCDTAVVAQVAHGGVIKPYTTAETMNSGWCWNIPMVHEDHRGYVFSSEFCTVDEAAAEMRATNPGMSDPWTVRFRSGRHEHFVRGNVAAVGNAYAFVEPLESTALHMVIIEVLALARLLDGNYRGTPDGDRAAANRRLGEHWDYLRWFLAIHYRYNRQRGTAFWRHCHDHVDVSGLQDVVDDFSAHGPLSGRGIERPPDAIFGSGGLDAMLLGQDVPTAGAAPRMSRDEWQDLCAHRLSFAAHALPQHEALAVLAERPDLLDELIHADGSWCAMLGRRMADPSVSVSA